MKPKTKSKVTKETALTIVSMANMLVMSETIDVIDKLMPIMKAGKYSEGTKSLRELKKMVIKTQKMERQIANAKQSRFVQIGVQEVLVNELPKSVSKLIFYPEDNKWTVVFKNGIANYLKTKDLIKNLQPKKTK